MRKLGALWFFAAGTAVVVITHSTFGLVAGSVLIVIAVVLLFNV